MDCYRCIDLRLKHWFRALDRTGWCRSLIGYGYGPLGDSGLDDPDSGLGIRAFLHTKHGIHDAGVPGAPIQQGEPYHSECDLADQLCADEGCRNSICRWSGVPAGIRYQGTMGHRLLLDCSHRTGAYHRHLHRVWWYEVSALHQRAADTYFIIRIAHHPGARTEGSRWMG